jgi:hypothetical protein
MLMLMMLMMLIGVFEALIMLTSVPVTELN